jgi:hypothetical protein
MTLHTFDDLEQGSPEWLDARRGIVTASVVGQLITPGTIKPASNDTSRALTMVLAAERITGRTEPVYVNGDMERGTWDEPIIRDLYREHYAPVAEVGFMVEDRWGVRIGYSPDGLVGDDGLIECKSPRAKTHFATILADAVPGYNMAQIQCGLLVSGRAWCDFISYRDGWPLYVKRVHPDPKWCDAIINAATLAEHNIGALIATYEANTAGLHMTERTDDLDEMVI